MQPVRVGQGRVVADPRQDRDALPVAVVGDVVGGREQRRVVAEDLADLGRPPGEGQALDVLGVGVLAGGERPIDRRELPEHVVERPGRARRATARSPVSAKACVYTRASWALS